MHIAPLNSHLCNSWGFCLKWIQVDMNKCNFLVHCDNCVDIHGSWLGIHQYLHNNSSNHHDTIIIKACKDTYCVNITKLKFSHLCNSRGFRLKWIPVDMNKCNFLVHCDNCVDIRGSWLGIHQYLHKNTSNNHDTIIVKVCKVYNETFLPAHSTVEIQSPVQFQRFLSKVNPGRHEQV